jgi:hypothetical protein
MYSRKIERKKERKRRERKKWGWASVFFVDCWPDHSFIPLFIHWFIG